MRNKLESDTEIIAALNELYKDAKYIFATLKDRNSNSNVARETFLTADAIMLAIEESGDIGKCETCEQIDRLSYFEDEGKICAHCQRGLWPSKRKGCNLVESEAFFREAEFQKDKL